MLKLPSGKAKLPDGLGEWRDRPVGAGQHKLPGELDSTVVQSTWRNGQHQFISIQSIGGLYSNSYLANWKVQAASRTGQHQFAVQYQLPGGLNSTRYLLGAYSYPDT